MKHGIKTKGEIIKEYKKVTSEGYNHYFLIEFVHNEKVVRKEVGVIGPFLQLNSKQINIYVDYRDESDIIIAEKFNYIVYFGFALISLILLISVIVDIY